MAQRGRLRREVARQRNNRPPPTRSQTAETPWPGHASHRTRATPLRQTPARLYPIRRRAPPTGLPKKPTSAESPFRAASASDGSAQDVARVFNPCSHRLKTGAATFWDEVQARFLPGRGQSPLGRCKPNRGIRPHSSSYSRGRLPMHEPDRAILSLAHGVSHWIAGPVHFRQAPLAAEFLATSLDAMTAVPNRGSVSGRPSAAKIHNRQSKNRQSRNSLSQRHLRRAVRRGRPRTPNTRRVI